MRSTHTIKIITICVPLFLAAQSLFAQIKLPRLVRDSMILQRDTKINIWGWASPNEKIKISFNKKEVKTKAGSDGKWSAQLLPMKAGGPYTMTLDGKNHIVLNDILIGDVWMCGGQSNMVHQMDLHKDLYADEIATVNYPEIRHFWIPTLTELQGPNDDLPSGSWQPANPANLGRFSAVAYYFAKTIYEEYHVPIGLINSSVGGTPVEAWTSEEGLKEFSALQTKIQKNKDTAYVNSTNRAAAAAAFRQPQQDAGMNEAKRWYDPTYIPKGWQSISIPGYWEDQGIRNLDGIVWYRKEIDIPSSMTGMPAKIAMGRIVDADFMYINGILVGNTTYQYPQRRYQVPAGVLKAGKNIFIIRVINNAGKGGFVPDKPYYLTTGKDTLSLKGDWQYKVGQAFIPSPAPDGPQGISAQNQPTGLYNAMIAPLTNYAVKGFLWYQGEANTSNAPEYDKLLPALIADWRMQWKNPNAPFLYVQLPNFMEAQYSPSESQWARLREAQLKTLSVPNTAMAVAIDLGEWNDIHPMNKKDVGIRLARCAEKLAYGENVVYSGPIYQSAKIDGDKIIISFNNYGSSLITSDGEEPGSFAIAGSDKKFVWAKAKIQDNTVIVWNDAVKNPMYVRYAWADNPVNANLFNRAGLPASPFRTDN